MKRFLCILLTMVLAFSCFAVTASAEDEKTLIVSLGGDPMTFNPVLKGECTQSELARRLTELVVKTAAGQPTKSEAQGHHEFFVPYKYQEKQVAFKRACEE